jgi:hypothetical protein
VRVVPCEEKVYSPERFWAKASPVDTQKHKTAMEKILAILASLVTKNLET